MTRRVFFTIIEPLSNNLNGAETYEYTRKRRKKR